MSSRISKIVNYQGKEYAHIVEDDPAPFCDFCIFSEDCSKTISTMNIANSPLQLCESCSKEAKSSMGFFIEACRAEKYVDAMNNKKVTKF